MNYRSQCCEPKTAQYTADFDLSRLILNYIEDLFKTKKVTAKWKKALFAYFKSKLESGIDEGYPVTFETYSKPLAASLKKNIAVFSAFKETSFQTVLETLMVSEKGDLVPWNEFKKMALEVSGEYNVRWLEAEYHQTVATANMAGKWQDFQANKELYPNLKYSTVGDDRVRPEHRIWDGIVKPLNDPFWKDNLPPNDWGCRCNVIQTDEDETDQPTGGTQLKIEFANNPGVSGKIFPTSTYEQELTKAQKAEAKKNLKDWTE